MLRSYPKIYNLGHRAVKDLLLPGSRVVVQEKIDGSQISFGLIAWKLLIHSKGAIIDPDAPPKMFAAGVEQIKQMAAAGKLTSGMIYRGEYLAKPKHNVLAYERVPKGHIILFDVEDAATDQDFASPDSLAPFAAKAGLEMVPCLYEGDADGVTLDYLRSALETQSCLGGQKIEGIVIKAYGRFGLDGKTLMGKHVNEAYKEVHNREWRSANPTRGDVVAQLIAQLVSPMRWEKAVQHLRDRGELKGEPADIGPLIKETLVDVATEEGDMIRAALFRHAWKDIGRAVTAGLPAWYKERLMKAQFAGGEGEQHE